MKAVAVSRETVCTSFAITREAKNAGSSVAASVGAVGVSSVAKNHDRSLVPPVAFGLLLVLAAALWLFAGSRSDQAPIGEAAT